MKIIISLVFLLFWFVSSSKIEKGNGFSHLNSQSTNSIKVNKQTAKTENENFEEYLENNNEGKVFEQNEINALIRSSDTNIINWYKPDLIQQNNKNRFLISQAYQNNKSFKEFIYYLREKTITNFFIGYSKMIYSNCYNCFKEFKVISKKYWWIFNKKNINDEEYKMIGLALYCPYQSNNGMKTCLFTEMGKIPTVPIDSEQGILFVFEILSNMSLNGEVFIYTPVISCKNCKKTAIDFTKKYKNLKISLFYAINEDNNKSYSCPKTISKRVTLHSIFW